MKKLLLVYALLAPMTVWAGGVYIPNHPHLKEAEASLPEQTHPKTGVKMPKHKSVMSTKSSKKRYKKLESKLKALEVPFKDAVNDRLKKAKTTCKAYLKQFEKAKKNPNFSAEQRSGIVNGAVKSCVDVKLLKMMQLNELKKESDSKKKVKK